MLAIINKGIGNHGNRFKTDNMIVFTKMRLIRLEIELFVQE